MTLSATLENATDLPDAITGFISAAIQPDPAEINNFLTPSAQIIDHDEIFSGEEAHIRWARRFTERRVSAQHFGIERDAHGVTLLYRVHTGDDSGPGVRRYTFALTANGKLIESLTVAE
ncbi:hypothetical protein D9V32_14180 [Mycetocola tolaasinivorans]|uniref:Nuclear transport factor 2 family protein n=1 Tax=Mycetocola tolaasinivorans TaxID=76635 RepID=A0A3L7A053_9MICO|nr:hypothetical protein [Mycetocola tolaasinivorans]RLP73673.1 hypothetical protein D9V32_14180 [Mycetocola tolaasinivorans]